MHQACFASRIDDLLGFVKLNYSINPLVSSRCGVGNDLAGIPHFGFMPEKSHRNVSDFSLRNVTCMEGPVPDCIFQKRIFTHSGFTRCLAQVTFDGKFVQRQVREATAMSFL